MKDATNNDMLWGDVSNLWSRDFRMGKPNTSDSIIIKWIYSLIESNPVNWNIWVTGGEERKKSISLGVASEKEEAQTILWNGVVGA